MGKYPHPGLYSSLWIHNEGTCVMSGLGRGGQGFRKGNASCSELSRYTSQSKATCVFN